MKSLKTFPFILAFLLTPATFCQGKMLDKIIAAINERAITLSEIQRIQENLPARRNISPQIYNKTDFTQKEVAELLIYATIISEKLAEVGYKITDDQVEEQIRSTEKRLGLNRDALLKFLEENNITFKEYFEIIRATIEYNIFRSKIIIPMISITDQQVKNAFFHEKITDNTLAFKYSLVSFTIPKDRIDAAMEKNLPVVLKKFQSSGVLPEALKDLETNDLGNITEEGLASDLREILKKTDEGSFSKPVVINGHFHVFYIRKKDLVESEIFLKSKDRIKDQLYDLEASKMAKTWLEKEAQKHYIKYFFN